MVTSAVDTAHSAEPTAVESQIQSDDFEAYSRDANARDLAKRRTDLGLPKPEESAPSKSEPKTETQPEKTEASTETHETSESETAAASETASAQETARKESSHQKLRRMNRELREQKARLEGELEAVRRGSEDSRGRAERREPQLTAEAAKPAAKPKFTDTDDKGQPKFKTYEEYEEARDNWIRQDLKRELSEGQQRSTREAARVQQEQVITEEWQKRVGEARKKHADYDEVALNDKLPIRVGSPVDVYILQSEHGTEVLYHLGKNPAELARINKLNSVQQISELTRIELKLSSPPPVKRVSSAPSPVRTVAATSGAGRDEVETALKEDDFDSYRRTANARDLARSKGR